MRGTIEAVRIVVTVALFVAVGAFVGLMLLPVTTGAEIRAVVSGSMEPTIPRGAVVVSMPIEPSEVSVGDVIMFHEPGQPERVITHRVAEIQATAPLGLITEGDNNDRRDVWVVGEQDLMGRVGWSAPKVGYLVMHMDSTAGFVGLLVIPSLLLLAGEARLWYRFVRYGNLEGPRTAQSHAGLFEVLTAFPDYDATHRRYGQA